MRFGGHKVNGQSYTNEWIRYQEMQEPLEFPDDFIDKVLCGNCLDAMKEMPDKCVDLILTDPPYGIGLEYDTYDDTEDSWFKLMTSFIPEARRIAKMVIMPSCRIKALPWIYTNFQPDWLICWYKGSPGHCAFVGFNDWEPHLVYGKTGGTQMHDYFDVRPTPFDNGHPCPKPIGWAKWLIERATREGDVVFDPFLGSGTTAVAAVNLGRHFIGIEISEEYCKIAEKRIKEAHNQTKLGGLL
jgi:DNA modification methylase